MAHESNCILQYNCRMNNSIDNMSKWPIYCKSEVRTPNKINFCTFSFGSYTAKPTTFLYKTEKTLVTLSSPLFHQEIIGKWMRKVTQHRDTEMSVIMLKNENVIQWYYLTEWTASCFITLHHRLRTFGHVSFNVEIISDESSPKWP